MSLRFDTAYYLEQNPDVAAAVTAGAIPGAEWHYETYGAAEGRNPNAVFDTSEYLEANPDVADAVAAGIVGPFAHFLAYGAEEGRAPSAAYQDVAAGFDESAYLDANPDVAALALRVDAVRFDDNGPRASASKDGGIDMALDFQNGGSLTFVDFLEAATLVEEPPLTSAVPSGESVALTGVNADDLSMLFGASLTFEA